MLFSRRIALVLTMAAAAIIVVLLLPWLQHKETVRYVYHFQWDHVVEDV